MIKKDNPAGRLYEILDKARNQHSGTAAITAWQRTFGVTSDQELFASLFYLLELIAEVKQLVLSNPDLNHELYLKDYAKIEEAVDVRQLNGTWSSYQSRLGDATMTSLAHIAETLSGRVPEQLINEDVLENLNKELEEIFKTIEESSLEPSFKILLLAQLEALRRSIAEYKIRGAKGLKESLANTLGHLLLEYDAIKASENEPAYMKFKRFLMKINDIIATALKYKELTNDVIKFLSGGDDAS